MMHQHEPRHFEMEDLSEREISGRLLLKQFTLSV